MVDPGPFGSLVLGQAFAGAGVAHVGELIALEFWHLHFVLAQIVVAYHALLR